MWLKRNRENLIVSAIVLVLVLFVLGFVPGALSFMNKALKVVEIILAVVAGIIFLCLTGVIGFFAPWAIEALDEALGNDQEISRGLKNLLIAVFGFFIPIAFVYLLALLTNIPLVGVAYQIFGNPAAFREVPLSTWGWYLWFLAIYFIGWGIGRMAADF